MVLRNAALELSTFTPLWWPSTEVSIPSFVYETCPGSRWPLDTPLREAERAWRSSRDVGDAWQLLQLAQRSASTALQVEVLESLTSCWEQRRAGSAAGRVIEWISGVESDRRLPFAKFIDRLACGGHPGAASRMREWFPPLARIVGSSPLTRTWRERVAEWARADHPVLLVGWSGVGHEMTARVIHELSGRAEFRIVYPGAVADALFGQELDRDVVAEGTTYLAYSDPDWHTERALELAHARHSRLIVGATDSASAPGWSNELSSHAIEIPELRDRFGDLRELVVELFRRQGHELDPPEAFLAHLRQFPWEGNVRHLDFALQRHLNLAGGTDPFRPEAWAGLTG